MSGQQRAVSDEERRELTIRRMCDTLKDRLLVRTGDWDRVQPIVQTLIEGTPIDGSSVVPTPGTKKRDHAELRRQWWETYYRSLGFNVTVPLPRFSNRVWTRETGRGRVVTPRAPTLLISYEAHMEAVGQGNHWTVKDEAERQKIVWEPTKDWYWYWADAQDTCPRLNASWNDLIATPKLHLLSLEEYMPFWHGVKADGGRMLDRNTFTWLRTRFGPGALSANGCDGQVRVSRGSESDLSIPHGPEGGRSADVV